MAANERWGKAGLRQSASGRTMDSARAHVASAERGGVTPFNLLPVPQTQFRDSAGSHGHGAGTPLALASWWTRYLVPPDGTACDPFLGSGTMALAALKHGASFVGGEKMPEYLDIARRRIDAARADAPLFD